MASQERSRTATRGTPGTPGVHADLHRSGCLVRRSARVVGLYDIRGRPRRSGSVLREAMAKAQVVIAARRTRRRRRPAELSDAIEGQVAEICRDVAVQVKRMRRLQEQADELRGVIREWARGCRSSL